MIGESQLRWVVLGDALRGFVEPRGVRKNADIAALQDQIDLLARLALVAIDDLEGEQDATVQIGENRDVHSRYTEPYRYLTLSVMSTMGCVLFVLRNRIFFASRSNCLSRTMRMVWSLYVL